MYRLCLWKKSCDVIIFMCSHFFYILQRSKTIEVVQQRVILFYFILLSFAKKIINNIHGRVTTTDKPITVGPKSGMGST